MDIPDDGEWAATISRNSKPVQITGFLPQRAQRSAEGAEKIYLCALCETSAISAVNQSKHKDTKGGFAFVIFVPLCLNCGLSSEDDIGENE